MGSRKTDPNNFGTGVREQAALFTEMRIIEDDREAYNTNPGLHPETTRFVPDRAVIGRIL